MSKAQIYLDHNATTPLDPRVAGVLDDCHRAGYANPASQHDAGRRARRMLEQARNGVARLLGANASDMQADTLIFTSGATEANNLALFGLLRRTDFQSVHPPASSGGPAGRIVISSIEHSSVGGPAEELERRGFEVLRLRVSRDGVTDVDHLRELLESAETDPTQPKLQLVSVILGNHETGVLQPVAEIAALCQSAGVPLHTDATQVVGKLPVDFRDLGASALSFSAHKFHGPPGIGGLLLRSGVKLRPHQFGGFQQAGLRPGTESVSLAAGLHATLQLWRDEAGERAQRMTELRDRFEAALRAELPNIVVHGAAAARLPHTSGIAFPGLDRQALLMALDQAGVACSTGSACASGSSEPSAVLLAMGCEKAQIEGSLRFSLGAFTTPVDIDQAAGRISNVVNHLRNQKSPSKSPATSRQ